jgi:hypothetical protein
VAEPEDGAAAMADHLVECRNVQAVIAHDRGVDGTPTVAQLLDAGWVLTGEEVIAGKRIRYLRVGPVSCRWCGEVVRHHPSSGLLYAARDQFTGYCPANPLTGNQPYVGRHMIGPDEEEETSG